MELDLPTAEVERTELVESPGAIALRVSNVSLKIGGTPILNNIYLELPQGSVAALVGPSGSGKSSLLRVLNRMWDASGSRAQVEGQVWFKGVNLYSRGVDVPWIRSRIGMIFQRPAPFPRSIYENLAMPLRVLGVSRHEMDARIQAALEMAVLWSEVKDRLHESALSLSGGQQQRLCIARALTVEPDVLLMDEPTSALDPGARNRIDELIESFKGRVTVLMVTHHLEEARKVADYMGVILSGNLHAFGPMEEILNQTKDPQVFEYLHSHES